MWGAACTADGRAARARAREGYSGRLAEHAGLYYIFIDGDEPGPGVPSKIDGACMQNRHEAPWSSCLPQSNCSWTTVPRRWIDILGAFFGEKRGCSKKGQVGGGARCTPERPLSLFSWARVTLAAYLLMYTPLTPSPRLRIPGGGQLATGVNRARTAWRQWHSYFEQRVLRLPT